MNSYQDYIKFDANECQALADRIFHDIIDDDEIETTLLHLALFTDGKSLKSIYPKMIEHNLYYPPEIYIHADSEIAEKLIFTIEEDNSNINHILICLAWIGTPNVIEFFEKSSIEKPEWTKKLHVLPAKYADQAGWEIDKNRNKRVLTSNQIRVLKNNKKCKSSDIAFQTFIEHRDNCPFCKQKLTTIFSIDIKNQKTEFTTCLLCGCYEPIFMRIGKDGKSVWHENNKKWEHFDETMEMDPIEPNTLVISDENRISTFTVSQFVEISKSQIGGHPTWIQDAAYLKCPDCEETMDFIGQIDFEDVEEYGEGLYYVQYCKNCNITGSNYQQS